VIGVGEVQCTDLSSAHEPKIGNLAEDGQIPSGEAGGESIDPLLAGAWATHARPPFLS
jgi:hypothetical protein